MDKTIEQLIERSVQLMDEKYLVVINRGYDKESIFYMGDDIMMAYKRLNELPYANKEVVLAKVKMCTMLGYELIESFDVIKKYHNLSI